MRIVYKHRALRGPTHILILLLLIRFVDLIPKVSTLRRSDPEGNIFGTLQKFNLLLVGMSIHVY